MFADYAAMAITAWATHVRGSYERYRFCHHGVADPGSATWRGRTDRVHVFTGGDLPKDRQVMTRKWYTEEEINGSSAWLAEQMRLSNQVEYLVGSARQFIFLAFTGISIGVGIFVFSENVWMALAAYGLGFFCNFIGWCYNMKAKAILQKMRDL